MAKLILITDTHLGVKGSSHYFHNNMEMFYNDIFMPYVKTNIDKIDGVVHLGDVFHDRRKIDTFTAQRSREYFFEPLYGILRGTKKKLSIICGNHDAYFKDSLDTNALNEFIKYQDYNKTGEQWVEVFTNISVLERWNVVFVPWITKNNREQFLEVISAGSRSCDYLFGHLELNGFNMSKVQSATHGEDPSIFSGYKHIFSGHYHYKHNKNNVTYLGSPTEQTWIDVDTTRGFHLFDTDTGELEFISNPYNIFQIVKFGQPIDTTISHPRYYRLLREGTEKQSEVEKYIEQLYANGAIDVDVIANRNVLKSTNVSESTTIESIEDTPEFIRNNVDDQQVADLIVGYYNRAISEQ